MQIHFQPSFCDIEKRTGKLTEMWDPLVEFNARIDWEGVRQDLSAVHEEARKSNGGAKPIDVVLMLKICH